MSEDWGEVCSRSHSYLIHPLERRLRRTQSKEFLKHTSKRARLFAQKPSDSQVSGHYGEKKHRGLAVLVGLIVKPSP